MSVATGKEVRNSFLTVFAVALVVAVVGRIGLALMDVSRILTYDYIASSTGTLFNQICSALTGPALVSFMALSGIVLALSVASVLVYAYWYDRGATRLKGVGRALAVGGATTAVGLVCALVFASGIMSAVQMASMKTKMETNIGMVVMGVMFVAAIVTLLAAACLVVCACVARARARQQASGGAEGAGHLGRNLVVATTVCGLVVVAVAIPTFASLNVAHIDGMVSAAWLALCVAANLAMLLGAAQLIKHAAKSIPPAAQHAARPHQSPGEES